MFLTTGGCQFQIESSHNNKFSNFCAWQAARDLSSHIFPHFPTLEFDKCIIWFIIEKNRIDARYLQFNFASEHFLFEARKIWRGTKAQDLLRNISRYKVIFKHSSVVLASIADFWINGVEFFLKMEKCSPKLVIHRSV